MLMVVYVGYVVIFKIDLTITEVQQK